MDKTQYIKHESADSRLRSEEGAFEAYINPDFVDESAPAELDMSNTDMLCYLMDSDLGSINHLMDPLLDPSNVFYYDTNLIPNYEQYLAQTATPSSEAQPPQPKRKAGRRKATKAATPFGSDLNDPTIRPDLVLSPEELEMVSKASPKERRQIRNKISARNFRLRRKEYVNGLEVKAKKYDEDISNLRSALDRSECEKSHLRSCVEDLMHKFQLLTTQIPELRKFKDLDPIHEISTSTDGQLVPTGSPTSNNLHSCRINFDPTNTNEPIDPPHFSTSRTRSFLVKA